MAVSRVGDGEELSDALHVAASSRTAQASAVAQLAALVDTSEGLAAQVSRLRPPALVSSLCERRARSPRAQA